MSCLFFECGERGVGIGGKLVGVGSVYSDIFLVFFFFTHFWKLSFFLLCFVRSLGKVFFFFGADVPNLIRRVRYLTHSYDLANERDF